jgi:HK97 family phage major capsid protein
MTLREQLALKLQQAKKAYEEGKIAEGDAAKAEATQLMQAIKGMNELETLQEVVRPPFPVTGTGSTPLLPSPLVDDAPMQAMYTLRFGEEQEAKSAVMKHIVGPDYRQTQWEQASAFAKYLRVGEAHLEREEYKLLKTQIFAVEDITTMIHNGFSAKEIKTTMVEAQGTLGGFAVPSIMQSEILRRLPGLTVVRSNGATVISLTGTNSTDILEVTGGNTRYTSGLRGAWGTESQASAEKNITLGMKSLNADVYTYKLSLTQSLVEDAANLVSLVQGEAVTTFAIDEDEAFLIGDGIGKPLGILPGSANTLALTEINSGNASLLTADGIKALKRGPAAQYRQAGVFVATSATFLAVEQLKDGNGQYLFPDLTDNDMLLRRKAQESEALPAIAANAFPIIFGNMMGYWIVERSGMTIARFQDSNTGINKVEYHFRRRLGGRVVKPWMFAVQKFAA